MLIYQRVTWCFNFRDLPVSQFGGLTPGAFLMQKIFQPWWTLYIIPSSWKLPRVLMETPFKWTAPDVANVVGTCCGACWNTAFSTRNTPSPPGGAGSSLVIESNSLQDIMALVALGKRWLECGVGWCNPQLSLMLFFAFDVSKNLFFQWNERNQWGDFTRNPVIIQWDFCMAYTSVREWRKTQPLGGTSICAANTYEFPRIPPGWPSHFTCIDTSWRHWKHVVFGFGETFHFSAGKFQVSELWHQFPKKT